MKNKLISMVEFVISTDKEISILESLTSIRNYASFLKQPLELWMFVPCGEDGEVLERPKIMSESIINNDNSKEWAKKTVQYQQAKERVLFEGFEYTRETNNYIFLKREGIYTHVISKNKKVTIEDLIPYNLTLTASALNQLK